MGDAVANGHSSRERDSQTARFYRLGGLVVATDTPHDPLFETVPAGRADIVIRRVEQDVIEMAEAGNETVAAWDELTVVLARHGNHVVRWPGWFDAVMHNDGRLIEVCEHERWPSLTRTLLAAVVPMAAVAHGRVVLHASSVVVDGASIVLAGDSGAGKSTMATAFCRLGARLLADDLTFIRLDDRGEARVEASAAVTRLFPEVATKAGASTADRLAEKHFVGAPTVLGTSESAPVRRLYRLDQGDGPTMTRVRGAEAAMLVLEQMFAELDQTPQAQALRLTLATTVVERAEVARISWRPRLDGAVELARTILEDLHPEVQDRGAI